jgi:hypothetical protein
LASSTPKKRRAEEGIPTDLADQRPVTEAILEGGYAWEEAVVGKLLAGKVHLAQADAGTALRRDRPGMIGPAAASSRRGFPSFLRSADYADFTDHKQRNPWNLRNLRIANPPLHDETS